MIVFLELRTCSVRIRGLMSSNRARAAIATPSNTNSTRKTQNLEQAMVQANSALVAVLPATAYFSKLAVLLGSTLPWQV